MVKDDSGNTVAELLFAQTPEGPLRGIYLLSRSLPEGWKWSLSNEEKVIQLESGQVKISVEDLFWRILDPQTYQKLKAGLDSGMVRVAAVFDTPSGKVARWKGASDMNFMVPEGTTRLSKFYVVWVDGFEHGIGKTIFKFSGGNVEISGSEGSVMLQADYWLTSPTTGKTILLMDLPFSGNFKPAFDIYVDDAGNLVTKPTLKYVLQEEIQNSWDVVKCEYQQTYYTTKGMRLDQVLIIHKADGGMKIMSLTSWLPSDIVDKPDHAIALLHTEDFINRIGGIIEKYGNEELKAPDEKHPRIPDFIVKIQGKETIWETKTGVEDWFHKQMVDEVNKDAWLVRNEGYIAYYYFDRAPSKEGAKKFLGYIRYIYENDQKLAGKVFVIIEGKNPVSPTDTSLDPYFLDPFPLPSG